MRRPLLALVAAALAAAAVPSYAAVPGRHGYGLEPTVTRTACSGSPDRFQVLRYPSGGQTAKAVVALPSGPPKGVVVFDHGYSHTMYSWVRHVQRTARTLGVIAVAPDYRMQRDQVRDQPLPSSRGWRVAEGAVDTNAVAALYDRQCLKGKGHNVLYSVSMGGNTAGLALAAQPKRVSGAPMFDEWVDVEGAVNVTETYLGARQLAPVNEFAAHAVEDIEAEMGGAIEDVPQVYADRTVVNRVTDIVAGGLKGVVLVHGVADGLVTHDESRQLQAQLLALRVPVRFTAYVTHSAGSEPGTTVDGYAPTGVTSPFAGHASEASETHDVGNRGFAELAGLYSGAPFTCDERVVDANAEVGTPVGVREAC